MVENRPFLTVLSHLVVLLGVVIIAFPVGIAAGVYLEEYAKPSKLTSFIQLNIRNLAGVPSVVYGLWAHREAGRTRNIRRTAVITGCRGAKIWRQFAASR